MEIFRFKIQPGQDGEKREAFKEAVNNCPQCHQPMSFQHNLDYLSNTLHEQAFCQHCQMQVREEDFRVQ